ncbi:MAG: Uma2 family endonuclease [Bdellovibrionota bacterium]
MASAARQLVTVEDWLHISDEVRCELIEGDIVYKALPSSGHSDSQIHIGATLLNEYQTKKRGSGGWWIRTEISVVYSGRPNGFIHDLAGWKKENYPEKPVGRKVSEKPDWVCEILSGNRKDDLDTKKWVLHEHKVPYYWIVDLESEIISVLEWNEKGYLIIADARKSEKRVLAPFDMEFDINVLLGNESE